MKRGVRQGITLTLGLVIWIALYRVLEPLAGWLTYGLLSLKPGRPLGRAVPMPGAVKPGMQRKGLLAAFLLGLVFGFALGPCTFAFMAPMLGVTFRVAATNLPYGILLLVLYGLGHCSVIVLAGNPCGQIEETCGYD